uniref:Uncharacterized protein n=1 Tax=Cacopsylla melanoneura TaxID=428564 RepID=A0A8D8QM22_9HEMI
MRCDDVFSVQLWFRNWAFCSSFLVFFFSFPPYFTFINDTLRLIFSLYTQFLHLGEQEPLDIQCDTTVKKEPIDEPMYSDTWETQEPFKIQDIKREKDYENCSNLEYTSNSESSKTKSTSEIRGGTVLNHSEEYKDNRYTYLWVEEICAKKCGVFFGYRE